MPENPKEFSRKRGNSDRGRRGGGKRVVLLQADSPKVELNLLSLKLIVVSIKVGVKKALLEGQYLVLGAYLTSNRIKTLTEALIDLGATGLAFINKGFTEKY